MQLQDSAEKQNEQVLLIEGGKQIVNVDNDTVVNRASSVPASAVQNQPDGKVHDKDKAGQNREGVENIADGAVGSLPTIQATASGVPIEEVLKLAKGPPKPSRDIPASTVFARMYLATAGALKAVADRVTVNVNEIVDRTAGDQHNAGKDRVDVGDISGGKVDTGANSQNPAQVEQQKSPRQISDRTVVAQISGNEKAGHKNTSMENNTGNVVEDDKRGDMNKKEGY